MVCVDSCNMATTENAESGLPENKGDRADPDAKYPLKVLYCGGEQIHEFCTALKMLICYYLISVLFYLQFVPCQ